MSAVQIIREKRDADREEGGEKMEETVEGWSVRESVCMQVTVFLRQ